MTVSTDEFLRRFLIHVLPKGLVRIRHSGLFANRRRAASLLPCHALLDVIAPAPQPTPDCQPRCPLCSEPMFIIERITSAQLFVGSLTASASKPRGIDSS
jgi:Putative transposase